MARQAIRDLNADLVERINAVLEERVGDGKCPSVFATLFEGSRQLLQSGRGESRIGWGPPGPETVYRIASCSKSFTATMLMMLRERGLLNLDAAITDFVPQFTQASGERAFNAPTVRMLMSMSGGLPTDDPWADRQESISNETLRAIAASGVHLTTAPGTTFQYSNLGYALLGQVVESVTGKGLREVVKQEILTPLGLDQTGYEKEIVADEQLARGYRRGLEGWVELPYSDPGAFSCIGGLFSSGRDLTTWVRWLDAANDDETVESGPLSIASRRELQQIVTAITQRGDLTGLQEGQGYHGYGLGLFCEFDQRYGQFVSHSGGYPGFSSHMRWHVPTGVGVVVLENATYSGAWTTATRLIELVLQDMDFQLSHVDVWPTTLEMAQRATSLILNWDDDVARDIFEENVALDVPFVERRQRIETLVVELGGISDGSPMVIAQDKSESPLHAVWKVPAAKGALSCEIWLSPKTPSLIQTFQISKESVPATPAN
jgi:CubicO group peptidase (beta-lactamase class C family)